MLANEEKIPEPPKFNDDPIKEPKLNNNIDISTPRNKLIDIPVPKMQKGNSQLFNLNQKKDNVDTDFPMPPQLDINNIPEKKAEEKLNLDGKLEDLTKSEDKKAEPKLDDLPMPPSFEVNDKKLENKLLEKPINLSGPKKEVKKSKKGFFSMFGKKKKQQEVKEPVFEELPVMPELPVMSELNRDNEKENVSEFKKENVSELKLDDSLNKIDESMPKSDIPMPPSFNFEVKSDKPAWLEEGEKFREHEMVVEAEHFVESEHQNKPMSVGLKLEQKIEPEKIEFELEPESKTPLSDVKGVGPKRVKLLKKAGIKTAEHLAKHDHKELSKKVKIPLSHARKIISHAKQITKVKRKLKTSKSNKSKKNIGDIINQLETERKEIEGLQKRKDLDDVKLIELEGHKEIVKVLEKLELKRSELQKLQDQLSLKENKLDKHNSTYKRDIQYIDNLKRRLDHDVRERTKYLIDLEKEYFSKAQTLAKQKSEVELKKKSLEEKEKFLEDNEGVLRSKLNDLEDREITIETKEKKLKKIMDQLDKQDMMLREKEDDLMKRESEYLKKLDILENHEKNILKDLENKRKSLSSKEKQVKLREERLHKTQRNVDKKEVAVEYAKNFIEDEKSKLIDDEFEQYLKDQLSGSGNINYNDIKTIDNLKVPNLGSNTKSLHNLVDTCRRLLKEHKVSEAKVYYNQLRERYYGMSFSNIQEKEEIHNTVRSLYDEINLADMSAPRSFN
jgi:predicted flap endonuclease-1-like 5' DNA nuclease